ncbi:MAG: TetR/AcrR family transcriptional regulator [Chitinophagaceae bacterium]|nr:TetR/AcrR family transcriptional regulator [Chitinophagaceae bacterium]
MTKGERTRQLIIEKSAPLFNKKGYAGTSLSDIMKATGLAKGGLYGNFKNKDEIAALTFEYAYSKIKTAILFKLSGCTTSVEKLVGILDFYRNYITNPPIPGGCPLLNTSVEADDSFPFLKTRARAAQNEMLNSLVQIFQSGKKHGELKDSIHPQREAEMMYALIEGGIVMAKINDNPTILHRILDRTREHIENNLAS